MAPCRILHCRSPVLFLRGGLYSPPHAGFTRLSTSSLPLHTVSVLSFSLVLFKVKTQHLYIVLPLAVCRSTWFQFVLFKKGPKSPSRNGLKNNSGKGSLSSGVSVPSWYSCSIFLSSSVSLLIHKFITVSACRIDLSPITEATAGMSVSPGPAASTTSLRVTAPAVHSILVRPGVALLLTSSLAPWINGSSNSQCSEYVCSGLLHLKRCHVFKSDW